MRDGVNAGRKIIRKTQVFMPEEFVLAVIRRAVCPHEFVYQDILVSAEF